ncbi:heterokaryon incompatibility protein-domain-containing protein, partial [Pisolithus marmoratus]
MRLIDITVLLNIEASINQGKGFDATTQILQEFYGLELEKKEYAILSHCWSEHQQEVSFREMNKLLVMSKEKRNETRGRTGYKKIINTCTQAQKDRMEWVWVDTCCIDKKSSAELSEAINSMYRWYAKAKLCYVYLHDVCDTIRDSWKNRKEPKAIPRWFLRGWTLQELIAPKVVRFFNQKWEYIGNKGELAGILTEITRIPVMVLWNGMQEALSSADNAGRPSVAQIISWAADRTTTREEDRAYSLLGLLGVHMPMMYGEGKNAFRRLQLKIIRRSNDHSIFAWGWTRKSGWSSSILADGPGCFRDCSRITILKPEEFTKDLREKGM